MKLRLVRLTIACKQSTETVDFADVSYFHGQIGAGKSSILHIVDYCLGANLRDTPALQSEFVQAELSLRVHESDVVLIRDHGSSSVHAAWNDKGEAFEVIVPARNSGPEVLPGTGVAVLSDLLFHIAGLKPPRVRRSKLKEDSELIRLSLRDMLRYCYLDQLHMESTLFHLEPAADFALRGKSKDVLRFVLGFHQERVAELERELDDLRVRRRATEDGASALRQALDQANVGSVQEIEKRLAAIGSERATVESEIARLREGTKVAETHGADSLRARARAISDEIASTEEACSDVERVLRDEHRHLNELRMLSVRFRRSDTARTLLRGVVFQSCPSCARELPRRQDRVCHLCGQPDVGGDASPEDIQVAESDAEARRGELSESIARREMQLRSFKRDLERLKTVKARTDDELSAALKQYDSLLLSSLLTLEHRRAALTEEQTRLEKLRTLPTHVNEMLASVDAIIAEESRARRELAEARTEAERDAGNLRLLEGFFKDCLVRVRLAGIGPDHQVKIAASTLYPQVYRPGEEDLIVANHGNLSSGGVVTLFKCCYAVAVHRLAAEVGGPLPSLLMLDTPMKNISERNNRELFEAFYDMLYELAADELKGTQLVLVDKEFRPPPAEYGRSLRERYMTPNDPEHPPLIGYYRETVSHPATEGEPHQG